MASNLNGNLIVDVEAYRNQKNAVKNITQKLEDIMNEYIKLMEKAKESGASSGETSNALENFINEIKSKKQNLSDIGKKYDKEVDAFLEEVDEEDDLLYENTGTKYFRDSDFDDILAVVDKTPELSREEAGGWLWNIMLKILSCLIPNLKSTFEDEDAELVRRMKETKEYTGEELVKMQIQLKNTDRAYQKKLTDIYYQLEEYVDFLNQIYSVVSKDFSMKEVNNANNCLIALEEMAKVGIVDNKVMYENKKIKYFADNVLNYFAESTSIIRVICEDSLGAIVTSDKDKYIATVRKMNEYFNEKSKTYLSSKEDFDSKKQEFDKLIALYKKYGGNFEKHYTGDKENLKNFNKLVDKIGDISKKSEYYIDIWYQMFFDMSESKEALNRFKALYTENELANESVKEALKRIEALYNKEVDAYIDTSLDLLYARVKKEGVQKAVKELGGMLPKEYSIISKMVGKIVSQAYAEAPGVALYDTVKATEVAFNNAVKLLKESNPSADNYQQLIDNVKEQFEYAKKIRIEFFETISKAPTSDQNKRYYELCIKDIKAASLSDVAILDMTSRGDYNGNFNYFIYASD